MPAKPRKPPAYRRREIRGKFLGWVTLSDCVTKERQDFPLGQFGTPQSWQLYARLIAEWEANGRRLSPMSLAKPPASIGRSELRICELGLEYFRWCEQQMSPGDLRCVHSATKLLNRMYGDTRAADFGPNALRLVREAMIQGDPNATPPRKSWTRKTCMGQTARIVAMFRWAAGRELVPVEVHTALKTLEPLRAGRTAAIESAPIECAPMSAVNAVLELANKQVAAMIRLQLATGMRPGEVVLMRPCDLDRSGQVWTYTPPTHKTAYMGKRRIVCLGPRAQRIVKPFLRGRQPTAPLFSPAEAEAARRKAQHAARKTPMSCGNRPGTNRRECPQKAPTNAYTTSSYRRAIARLCEAADAAARARAAKRGEKVESGIRFVQEWHPHQLRHNAATEIRRRHGLEAAQLMLGHSSAMITDAVYADRDQEALLRIAADCG